MLCGDEEVEMKKGGRSDVHSKCGSPQYSAKSFDKLKETNEILIIQYSHPPCGVLVVYLLPGPPRTSGE